MKRGFILISIFAVIVFAAGVIACDGDLKGENVEEGVFLPVDAKTSENGEIPTDWVAVKDGKITVSAGGEIRAYELSKCKEIDVADSADGALSLSVDNGVLTLDDKGRKTEYVLSEEYVVTDFVKESMIPVSEPVVVSEEGGDSLSLKAKYNDSVINAITVEIKTADSGGYERVSVVKSEDGGASVLIPSDKFVRGDNYVRLSNSLSYPMIDGDKNLYMQAESGAVEYKVTVDETGKITYLQNDFVLSNGVYKFAYSDELTTAEEKDYCNFVVVDGTLTESFKGGKSLYYLSDVDGVYSMKLNYPDNNASKTFTVKNGVITVTVNKTGAVYQLKKDDEYVYSEDAVKLEKPANPEFGVEDYASGKQVWFRFFAPDTSYPVGVRTEIKRAGSENYEFYNIDVPYRADIYVDGIGADKFDKGYNFIRICNVGAPVSTNEKHYYMTEDSEYIEFIVLLDETGIQISQYYGEQ